MYLASGAGEMALARTARSGQHIRAERPQTRVGQRRISWGDTADGMDNKRTTMRMSPIFACNDLIILTYLFGLERIIACFNPLERGGVVIIKARERKIGL